MSTSTDVFAQRTPLFGEDADLVNPVDLAMKISLLSGEKFIDLLTEETLPNSFTATARKLSYNLSQGDTDYHPFGLPSVAFNITGVSTEDTYPVFWLRNQNIDLDSCWWNIYTEMGYGYNNNPTNFNSSYWHRTIDDPDFPDDATSTTSLADRFKARITDGAVSSPLTADAAVPYELDQPYQFHPHPEYVATDAILQTLGLDLKANMLDPLRENASHEDIDHVLFGFFTGLVPKSEEEGEYLHRFFRHAFENRAFTGSMAKTKSACVSNALKTEGFYNADGDNLGWINDDSISDVSDGKSKNYYYEYKASDDSGVDLEKLFDFTDPRDEMNLEFRCDDVIIRKVRGKMSNKDHNDVVVTVGKGETFPEFTHFRKAVTPVDPDSPGSFTPAVLEAYDQAVTQNHKFALQDFDSDLGVDKDPTAWIAFRQQKKFSTHNAHTTWDSETATTLNAASERDYIEEIIIVNPRVIYRGIYSAGFKTKAAYKVLHDTSATRSADNPSFKQYNQGDSAYVTVEVGTTFPGDTGDSDALVIPTLDLIVDDMLLKKRELVIAGSMSTLNIAIVRTSTSWVDDVLKVVLFIVIVAFAIIPGGQAIAAELAAITTLSELVLWLSWKYVLFTGIEAISDELVSLLVDEFGLESVATLISVIIAVTAFKSIPSDPTKSTEFFMSLAANLDDSFMTITQGEFEDMSKDFEDTRNEIVQRQEALDEIEEDLLGSADPNLSLATMVFLLSDESPTEFFDRTIEDKNPGIKVLGSIETEISRFKLLDHTKPPIIATDELTNAEYLDQLV